MPLACVVLDQITSWMDRPQVPSHLLLPPRLVGSSAGSYWYCRQDIDIAMSVSTDAERQAMNGYLYGTLQATADLGRVEMSKKCYIIMCYAPLKRQVDTPAIAVWTEGTPVAYVNVGIAILIGAAPRVLMTQERDREAARAAEAGARAGAARAPATPRRARPARGRRARA